MGSGKTSVGKKLADVLRIPFKDLDAEIEKQEGRSISDIFMETGEIYFRMTENKILKKLLSQPESFVLATGGGTPCYGDNMAVMIENVDVRTVYLKTTLEALTYRLFLEKEKRPLLAHLKTAEELDDFIRKHLFERVYYYSQSKYIVENKDGNIGETVAAVVRLF